MSERVKLTDGQWGYLENESPRRLEHGGLAT